MANESYIQLTQEEISILWNGLAAGKLFFEEQPNRSPVAQKRLEDIQQMLRFMNFAREVTVKVDYSGLTPEGMKRLNEIMQWRKEKQQKREKDARVIEFPGRD